MVAKSVYMIYTFRRLLYTNENQAYTNISSFGSFIKINLILWVMEDESTLLLPLYFILQKIYITMEYLT